MKGIDTGGGVVRKKIRRRAGASLSYHPAEATNQPREDGTPKKNPYSHRRGNNDAQ
eukprot:CAMPEP_0184717372 /NCGR_PEP_ID=MMETSP0314-20130426/6869_1 /TAXON_ID=38298 /ORGANISM="Rhodella maculata, Strain CCMP 736" /LENGTH=55 /DNA_ID=CAMNT_0027180931 /DNA_START=65 /DNA_END=229 /DNA_ORIENTATION=-